MRRATAILWSGGKDSALVLHALRQDPEVDVTALLTVGSLETDRVQAHGISLRLIRSQASSLGIPLRIVDLPSFPSNEHYELHLLNAMTLLNEKGILHVACGDLFLEDLRHYRDRLFARAGMKGLYPLWGMDPKAVMHRFFESGFKAIVVVVQADVLPISMLGRPLDSSFLKDLPPHIDPAGEYGEYHSLVWDGPGFAYPVPLASGRPSVVREVAGKLSFAYLDL